MQASVYALGLLIAVLPGPGVAQPALGPTQSFGEATVARRGTVVSPKVAIREIIAEFRGSITRKDRERFLSLFLDPSHTSWQAVNGDRVVETKRTTDPSVVKAKINPNATPASFIETVASRAAISDEVFNNIKIDADADVAAVSFAYAFKLDSRVKNTGIERWLLVRTDQGWRITSVNWSIETYTP